MVTLAEAPQQKASVSFKSILLATDFSDASEKAFKYATTLARSHNSKICLVHVLPPESASFIPELPRDRQRHQAEGQMENLASRSELNQIAHETVVRAGSVWKVLSAVFHEQNIELVVLGTHGRSGLKKLVLGSVAEEVMRLARCPVLTVGPDCDAPSTATEEFRRIVFATDFHTASVKAFDYALLLASQPQAKLVLLHVMPPTALPGPEQHFYDDQMINNWQATARATTKEKLEKLLPPEGKLWSEPEYVVEFDFIAAGIVKVAAERKADLIIMGANRPFSAKMSAHTVGTVSHEVIRHSKCPVLTVST